MPDFDIFSESGEEFSIGGQVTKPATAGQPPPWPNYPSNATGFTLTFTAKRTKQDTQPVVSHAGSLANGGAWTVKLLAADTAAFAKTEELLYDVTLAEPDGTKTVVSKGRWVVDKSVGL